MGAELDVPSELRRRGELVKLFGFIKKLGYSPLVFTKLFDCEVGGVGGEERILDFNS